MKEVVPQRPAGSFASSSGQRSEPLPAQMRDASKPLNGVVSRHFAHTSKPNAPRTTGLRPDSSSASTKSSVYTPHQGHHPPSDVKKTFFSSTLMKNESKVSRSSGLHATPLSSTSRPSNAPRRTRDEREDLSDRPKKKPNLGHAPSSQSSQEFTLLGVSGNSVSGSSTPSGITDTKRRIQDLSSTLR